MTAASALRHRYFTSPLRGEVGEAQRAEPGEGESLFVGGTQTFKQRARRLRRSQTSAEDRLWQALRNRRLARWKFRRQHPIERYIVDFVTLDGRLVVEVDGATHSTVEEIARDTERTRVLDSIGFRVLRATNLDVYENLDGVLEMIHRELNQTA